VETYHIPGSVRMIEKTKIEAMYRPNYEFTKKGRIGPGPGIYDISRRSNFGYRFLQARKNVNAKSSSPGPCAYQMTEPVRKSAGSFGKQRRYFDPRKYIKDVIKVVK
jgi:hypothetical protein